MAPQLDFEPVMLTYAGATRTRGAPIAMSGGGRELRRETI